MSDMLQLVEIRNTPQRYYRNIESSQARRQAEAYRTLRCLRPLDEDATISYITNFNESADAEKVFTMLGVS